MKALFKRTLSWKLILMTIIILIPNVIIFAQINDDYRLNQWNSIRSNIHNNPLRLNQNRFSYTWCDLIPPPVFKQPNYIEFKMHQPDIHKLSQRKLTNPEFHLFKKDGLDYSWKDLIDPDLEIPWYIRPEAYLRQQNEVEPVIPRHQLFDFSREIIQFDPPRSFYYDLDLPEYDNIPSPASYLPPLPDLDYDLF